MKQIVWVVGLLMMAAGCTPSSEQAKSNSEEDDMSSPNQMPAYAKIANERFSGKIEYLWNLPKTHVICIEYDKSGLRKTSSVGALPFFIFDVAKNAVVYEDRPLRARISWISDTVVFVAQDPGIVQGDESETGSPGYYYDVEQQKKTTQLTNPD